MTHYEERLDKDLTDIRAQVAEMAELVNTAVKDAIHSLQTGDGKLAAATVLNDHPVNRMMRKIDAMCHKFIALHLPSAGHLRLLSSVIRVNIELERIGDYAVTIGREALQLSKPPQGHLATELQRVSNETQSMLRSAIEAFNELNAEKARVTMVLEEHMENNLDVIYAELAANSEQEAVKDVLAMFAVFTQLKRVVDQAKNLCEETVFAATGDTKAPKVYNVLFVDNDNSCLSQMAAAIATKNYPDGGVFTSAGRSPASELNAAMVEFLDNHGISVRDKAPAGIGLTPQEVSTLHVIVSLEGPVSSYFDQVPFHTTPIEWDVGAPPAAGDAAESNRQLEELYREVALKVRDLMEILRGEDAS